MASSLSKLKGFIQTYSGYNFANVTPTEVEDLKAFVADALANLRWEIESEYGAENDERLRKQQIVNLQSQLTYLVAGINGFNQADKEAVVSAPIMEWVVVEIHKLLQHLKSYFPADFDSGAELPVGFVEHYKSHNRSIWDDFTEKIAHFDFNKELKALILNFSDSSNISEKFALRTWEQLDYLILVMRVISNFLDDPPATDLDLNILKLFVGINFNSIQVYAFFIRYIEKITIGDASFQEQQEQLLYLLKIFKQVRLEAVKPYDPKVQSLKLSIVESLEAELSYLEQKEKLFLQNFKNTNPDAPSKFYFNVAVTLAELMFFFRVMLEVKVIYTKFNSYLYEFIANHIRTERAENISKKSMRNHFNNKPFPDRVVQNVKAWLEKMINHINLYYDL
jgi:hypothetical protein